MGGRKYIRNLATSVMGQLKMVEKLGGRRVSTQDLYDYFALDVRERHDYIG